MKKKLLIIFISFSISIQLHAQKGDFYLTHYTPESEQIENENFAITQDANGQMQFANAKGVLKFDGRFWQITQTPSTALSIALDDKTGILYVGCLDNFGYIKSDENGNDVYTSIFQTEHGYVSVSKISITDKFVYFLGDGVLYEFDKSQNKVTHRWESGLLYDFQYMFRINNELFICDKLKGVLKVKNNEIENVVTNFPQGQRILFAAKIDEKSRFVGTDANQYYKFDGTNFEEIKIEDAAYLKNSSAFDALVLQPNLAIIATAKGGCLLFNLASGKTVSIINYYSGLPDDEVFAIGKDAQSGVWIAHEYGFTRLDYYLPFRSYNSYPGLEGHIEAALTYKDKLYVATSEGVYYLNEVKDYAEVIKYIKVKKKKKLREDNEENKGGKLNLFIKNQKEKYEKIKSLFGVFKKKKKQEQESQAQVKEENKSPEEPKQEPVEPQKEKKFLGIFKKKSKEKPVQETPPVTEKVKEKQPPVAETKTKPKPVPAKPKPKVVTTVKIVQVVNFELQSVKYVFKKVEGIDAKCRQLLLCRGKLLVATNNGIYEIDGAKAKLINPAPVSYIYVSRDQERFFAGTEDKKLLCYINENGQWKQKGATERFPDKVLNITEDNDLQLWVSCSNSIFRINNPWLGAFNDIDTVRIHNPFSDDIHLINTSGKIYAITSSDAFYYDHGKKQLVKDESFAYKSGNYIRAIHSENGIIWFSSKDAWGYLSDMVTPNKNFVYFKLFKDIQEIFLDSDKKNCWITTKNGLLYRFDISNEATVKNIPNIFLQKAIGQEGQPLVINSLEINQNSSKVAFSFVNPEYIDNESLQYQYKLIGLSDEWSEWSSENQVSFNFLPSNNYQLVVRTRNALNQVTESNPLSFKVKPPYWQEWWFYLLELLFFGSLLFLSIMLNRSTHKNLWISKVLTFITIIMMLEFVSTVAESYINFNDSPVINFLFQVFMAVMIFPFEQIISVFITENPEKVLTKLKRKVKE